MHFYVVNLYNYNLGCIFAGHVLKAGINKQPDQGQNDLKTGLQPTGGGFYALADRLRGRADTGLQQIDLADQGIVAQDHIDIDAIRRQRQTQPEQA